MRIIRLMHSMTVDIWNAMMSGLNTISVPGILGITVVVLIIFWIVHR